MAIDEGPRSMLRVASRARSTDQTHAISWHWRALWLLALAALQAAAASAQPSGFQQGTEATAADPSDEDDDTVVFNADENEDDDDQGGGVIFDPELADVPPVTQPGAQPQPATPDSSVSEGQARVVLRTRVGLDTQFDDPHEDVLEATQIGLVELRVKRSERVLFAAGVRLRHVYATRREDTPEAEAERFELDATPTAGYGDVLLGDGLHVRIGYQLTHIGRFDVWNASDILSRYDLRSGPTTMPEANDIAQPAIRADWDVNSSLSLSAYYVPFFAPHRIHFLESDYALSPVRGQSVDPTSVPADDPALALSRALRELLPRSNQAQLGDSGFAAFAPPPNLAHPQAALRATLRGASFDLGLTAGTALEHLPSLELSDQLRDALVTGAPLDFDALAQERAFAVSYPRFFVVSADAGLLLGPVQLGAEAGLFLQHTLQTVQAGDVVTPARADVAQVGVRAEYLIDDSWVLAAESVAQYALTAPPAGRRYLFMTPQRMLLGAVGFLAFKPGLLDLTFELAGGILNGPTALLSPRVAIELAEGLSAELGAVIVEGHGAPTAGDPSVTLGGLYDDVDQVFVGLRWTP